MWGVGLHWTNVGAIGGYIRNEIVGKIACLYLVLEMGTKETFWTTMTASIAKTGLILWIAVRY